MTNKNYYHIYLNHLWIISLTYTTPHSFCILGLSKNILTTRQKFFIPNLMHYIRSSLKACQICQMHKAGSTPQRQFENRINHNYISTSKLSCNIKYMCRKSTGHKFILSVTNEVVNDLIAILLYRGTLHEVGEALINYVFCKHAPLLFNI